jgi:t-SNARE complex subunit (syntaxin)
MVINQGSLIDRIDYYTDETYECMKRGNEHLVGADKKAHNSCAGKCIYVLMTAVIILAIILGFKYSSKD